MSDALMPPYMVQLAVNGARFWIAGSPDQLGRFNPASIAGATARFLLVVDDPRSVADTAVAAGGKLMSQPTEEHCWLVRRVVDPFGHEWEIGRPLGAWPPAT
jgi:PhnB protein